MAAKAAIGRTAGRLAAEEREELIALGGEVVDGLLGMVEHLLGLLQMVRESLPPFRDDVAVFEHGEGSASGGEQQAGLAFAGEHQEGSGKQAGAHSKAQ